MKPSMDEQRAPDPQPCRRLIDGPVDAFGEAVIFRQRDLTQRFLKRRITSQATAFKGAAEFAVMIAENEKPALLLQKIEHQLHHARAVRSVIDEVSELDDEAFRRRRVPKSIQIAMHVPHHANAVFTDSRHDGVGKGRINEDGACFLIFLLSKGQNGPRSIYLFEKIDLSRPSTQLRAPDRLTEPGLHHAPAS